MSLTVTLHESIVSDFRFFSCFRLCSPARVIREFETFKETSVVNPVSHGRENMRKNIGSIRRIVSMYGYYLIEYKDPPPW